MYCVCWGGGWWGAVYVGASHVQPTPHLKTVVHRPPQPTQSHPRAAEPHILYDLLLVVCLVWLLGSPARGGERSWGKGWG